MSFDAKKNADLHNNGIAVRNKDGEWVVMNRNAKIAIVDDTGREREKYPVVYGAKIKLKDGDRVEVGKEAGGVGSLFADDFDGSRRQSCLRRYSSKASA